MVKIDWYLRAVLTIIAASLIWLCINSETAAIPLQAQSAAPQRVIVAGWADQNGFVHAFPPLTIGGSSTVPSGLPVRDVR
jgi:hypothetical protein